MFVIFFTSQTLPKSRKKNDPKIWEHFRFVDVYDQEIMCVYIYIHIAPTKEVED